VLGSLAHNWVYQTFAHDFGEDRFDIPSIYAFGVSSGSEETSFCAAQQKGEEQVVFIVGLPSSGLTNVEVKGFAGFMYRHLDGVVSKELLSEPKLSQLLPSYFGAHASQIPFYQVDGIVL
jgi:hypothetical protein